MTFQPLRYYEATSVSDYYEFEQIMIWIHLIIKSDTKLYLEA